MIVSSHSHLLPSGDEDAWSESPWYGARETSRPSAQHERIVNPTILFRICTLLNQKCIRVVRGGIGEFREGLPLRLEVVCGTELDIEKEALSDAWNP